MPDNFKNYFVIKFDKPFLAASVLARWKETAKIEKGISEYKDKHVGALIPLSNKERRKDQPEALRRHSSVLKQAELNLAEVGNKKLESYQRGRGALPGTNLFQRSRSMAEA
ncbi:MAG: hypothetical protein WDO15_27510 [Bacteroidota bacterium]